MIFGYIRVSSDKQTVENQRFEINEYCKKHGFSIEKWFDEVISGTKKVEERKLGRLLEHLSKGDILICSEISRLGRSLLMIMSILNICMEKEVQVWTIRDNFRLGNDVSSKVLAFAFGLSAEIERSLISHRTKEALARLKSEGVHIGRPAGSKSRQKKLTGKSKKIQKLLDVNTPKNKIAKKFKVHPSTLRKFLSE
ncbi:MAG: master DNA invertase Mpi family serine-type recombinase [Fibrobacter sp.]|jgi:DNA invertase Pin-like site-specific DNA recombinase|nr:master DNA invertase Mpi family serine-type recombinase [Fibrobacter sp.]